MWICKHVRSSLVKQLVKNPPGIQETWVQPLGWEDPLVKGKATPASVFWPGEFHGLQSKESKVQRVQSHKESDTAEQPSPSLLGLNSDLLTGTPLGIKAAGESKRRVSDCRKTGKKVQSVLIYTGPNSPVISILCECSACCHCAVPSPSRVRPFVTPRTVAH